jgi:hypothetical protein
LEAAKKALSEEKIARLAVDQSLAEEKVTQRTADQSLQASEEAKAAMNQDLLSAQASLTATKEKLPSKSSALDCAMIKEHEAQIKLEATEEKRKAQEQQLESAQKALSKREFSSSVVISSAVANDMVLVKNHVTDFDAEILWRDFTIDEGDREALVDSAYDVACYFVSQYDFSILPESNDNANPSAL